MLGELHIPKDSVAGREQLEQYLEGRRVQEDGGEKARRILQEELDRQGWTAKDLAARSKGDVRKVRMARRLRMETSVTWKWISEQLHMGTWTHAASLKIKIEPDEQNEFKLE